MINIQNEIFNRLYEKAGFVSLALLPTVRQIEQVLAIDPMVDVYHMNSEDARRFIHHCNSHKNIFIRGNQNESNY